MNNGQATLRRSDLRASLVEAINAVPLAFESEVWDLAYLTLTSKPEGLLRDALALALRRRYTEPDVIVAREWAGSGRRRADLALLDNAGEALAIVECKVTASFGVVRGDASTKQYPKWVEADLKKTKNAVNQKTPPVAFAVLWVFHPTIASPLPENLKRVVKYNSMMTPKRGTAEARADSRTRLEAGFGNLSGVALSPIESFDAGAAFGIPVAFDAWLVEATS